jgi:hypothetical protein
MAVWEVARTNRPRGPVTCDGCGEKRWWHETYRVRFKGMTHVVGTTAAERHHHGPGLWVCPTCRRLLEGHEPDLWMGVLMIGRTSFALEAPEPEQASLW